MEQTDLFSAPEKLQKKRIRKTVNETNFPYIGWHSDYAWVKLIIYGHARTGEPRWFDLENCKKYLRDTELEALNKFLQA